MRWSVMLTTLALLACNSDYDLGRGGTGAYGPTDEDENPDPDDESTIGDDDDGYDDPYDDGSGLYLHFTAQYQVADIAFVLDTTGSMG